MMTFFWVNFRLQTDFVINTCISYITIKRQNKITKFCLIIFSFEAMAMSVSMSFWCLSSSFKTNLPEIELELHLFIHNFVIKHPNKLESFLKIMQASKH